MNLELFVLKQNAFSDNPSLIQRGAGVSDFLFDISA